MYGCGTVWSTNQKTASCSHCMTPILINVTDVTATSVVCEEEDGHISYHPDKADCTMYYMCEGERKHHMPCPSNLVFNPNENVCDWPENVEGCMHHTQAPPTAKRK